MKEAALCSRARSVPTVNSHKLVAEAYADDVEIGILDRS